MYCWHCGQELPDNAVFCSVCGSAQDEQPHPPAAKKRWLWPLLTALLVVLAVVVTLAVTKDRPAIESGGQGNPAGLSGGENDSDVGSDTETTGSSALSSSAPVNTPVSTAPTTTAPAPVITGPTLPDPAAFFGGLTPVEDEPAEESGWYLYFRMQIDDGWTAAHEYVDLLKDPRFELTQRETFGDTVLYLVSEYYFFDYTGEEEIAPVEDRYYFHGYKDYTADVFVWIQKNAQSEYTSISVYYSCDMEVKDLGDRSTALPDYTEGNGDDFPSNDEPYIPDYAKLPCLTCDGDGDCTECGGYGTIDRYNGGGEYIDSMCPDCRGSGNCTDCGGSGTR